MELSQRELWTVIHGMGFGAVFLLAFGGGLAGLYSLRPEFLTVGGLKERMTRLNIGMWVMAGIAWLTVYTGTYIVYPWYRAAPPQGAQDLTSFPRSFLLANPSIAEWHNFGMEWKEHVAWLAPIAATMVAFIVTYYGPRLVSNEKLRRVLIYFFLAAFITAAIAGVFGAFINKVAPVR